MKILRDGNRSVTVRINGELGIRQAIGLPRLISLFPKHLAITVDFSGAEFDRASAVAALIPALASLHRPSLKVVGLENAEAAFESFDDALPLAA